MNINQDNITNNIPTVVQVKQPSSPQRKRSLSESSNSSNSKRSCSIDLSPSPTDNNNISSNTLVNSVNSLGCSKLNLMEDINNINNDQQQLISTTTSTIESDPSRSLNPVTPTREQIEDDRSSTTIMATSSSSSTTSPAQDLEDYESLSPSLPSYTSLTSLTTTSTNPSKPDGSTQIEIIKDQKEPLATGDSWYLISREWYRKWETACSGIAESKEDDLGFTVDEVGAIDNTKIQDENGDLKKNLMDGIHVVMVTRVAWELLKGWYGVIGNTFERQVVSTSAYGSERVEFYPPSFQFQVLLPTLPEIGSGPPPPAISLSAGATLKELKLQAIEIFSLRPQDPIRFWRLNENSLAETDNLLVSNLGEEGGDLIQKPGDGITDDSLLSASLLDNELNRLAVEQQEGGKWLVDETQFLSTTTSTTKVSEGKKTPLFGGTKAFFDTMEKKNSKPNILQARNKSAIASTSKSVPIAIPTNSSGSSGGGFIKTLTGALTRSQSNSRSGQKGLTGLQNLGNTCFMNSALQCMSNTKELQEYFTSGVYKNELNPDNPLGMNGQVAEAFGQLIERLWSNSGSSVAPREFKQALSKFAPSFSGYGQQDSQELLAFLLDGTHEDLNRIKVKPATNAPDWVMGGGDKELVDLARICWEQYRSRNDSVIVDLFQGQYRSTVVCPDCSKVSITFDPFMYVTTNLPVMKKWTGEIIFVPIDTSKLPVVISLELPKTAILKSAKTAIGNFMGVDGKKILIAEAWKGKFWKMWYDDDMITEVQSNDVICAFETTTSTPQPKPRHYGKTKPVPIPIVSAEEVPIIIAVSGYCSVGKPKKFAMSSSGDFVGHPFLLSLTRAQASSYAEIEKALKVQYARYTYRGEDLIDTAGEDEVEAEEKEDDKMNGTSISTSTSDSTLALSVPLPTTEPTTPTIGQSMDVDDQSSTLPSPPPEPEKTIDPSLLTSTPTTDTSTTTETSKPTTAKARSPFKITISPRPKSGGVYPFENKDCPESDAVPLKTRAISRNYNLAIPIATPSTSTSTTPDDSTETSSKPPLVPIVATGDYMIVEWDPSAASFFFGQDTTKFGTVERFEDPAITSAKERSAQGGKKQSITIEDCLNEFTKEERLGEDDTWYCPDCKKHQQATKKVEIWKVPDVLVFNLKRFSASRYSRDKIDDLVAFPIKEFNMEPFVEGDKVEKRLAASSGLVVEEAESLIYDLYAVDNHYGGMGGGHYTAYAKNHENGKWYDFDDSRVSEISESRVQTPAAYLLFYRRRTARPIGAKSRELVDSALQSALQSRMASTSASRGASPSISNRHSRASSIDGAQGGFLKHDQNFMSVTSTSESDKAEPGTPRSMSPFDVVMNHTDLTDSLDETIDYLPYTDPRDGYDDYDDDTLDILPDIGISSGFVTINHDGETSNDLEDIE